MEYPIAVISDIHSNIEALTTVLADIDARGIKRLVSLGDNIGYGPNPRDVLDALLDRIEWSLMGNHDFGVLYEPTNFNAGAEAAIFWTRSQLEDEPDPDRRERWWSFFGKVQTRGNIGDVMCVHASPRRPINEYIFPDDVTTSPSKMKSIFERIDHVCLVGHTHVQGIFTEEPDFIHPSEVNWIYEFPKDKKTIINVGSVGQPRDRDPRSAYSILYEDRIEFIRLDYDMQTTARKIEDNPYLPDFFSHRLLDGR